MNMISDNVKEILKKLPEGVQLIAAVKTRTAEEIREAVDAGIRIIGENYVQEAVSIRESLNRKVKYHFIGHLQRNKIKKAVEIFDMNETVDSIRIAEEIDRRSGEIGKIMPVLIEVNSGHEPQKFGVLPENLESLIRALSALEHIEVHGLMTMGPLSGNP
jgi:pyridoxal phosphate enzyme (YggS family)